jgi:hypothetical protein
MAPRVPRAVPQGRPAPRGSVIVSSGSDYNTEAAGYGFSPGSSGRNVTT